MIKSMTGFGRSEYTDGKRNITVEIKSVNHRYSDISVRMPRRYSFAEDKIKASVKAILIRGKIEVSVMVEYITENDMTIKLNEPLARQYYDNLRELKENFGLSGDISLEMIANMPDVLKAIPDVEDEEEITKAILIPVEQAAANLEAMRKADPVLTEPIMKVVVTVPEDYMGDVIGDLNSRRGAIQSMEARTGAQEITAFVPLSEMFGYATDLRSKTQGRGVYSMEPSHYTEVPKSVSEAIIGSRQKA